MWGGELAGAQDEAGDREALGLVGLLEQVGVVGAHEAAGVALYALRGGRGAARQGGWDEGCTRKQLPVGARGGPLARARHTRASVCAGQCVPTTPTGLAVQGRETAPLKGKRNLVNVTSGNIGCWLRFATVAGMESVAILKVLSQRYPGQLELVRP